MSRFLVPLALAFLSLRCMPSGPATVYRLVPADSLFKWVYGEPVVTSEKSDIKVVTSFIEHSGGKFVFYVEAWNFSEDTVLLAPDDFLYTPYHSATPDPADTLLSSHGETKAFSPDGQMATLGRAIHAEQSQHAAYQAVDGIGTLLGLISDIATLGEPKTKQELRERDRIQREREESRIDEENSHRNRMAAMENARSMWQSVALRKTTLYPGESAGGKVLFPVSIKSRYLRLILPVGNSLHTVIYEWKTL